MSASTKPDISKGTGSTKGSGVSFFREYSQAWGTLTALVLGIPTENVDETVGIELPDGDLSVQTKKSPPQETDITTPDEAVDQLDEDYENVKDVGNSSFVGGGSGVWGVSSVPKSQSGNESGSDDIAPVTENIVPDVEQGQGTEGIASTPASQSDTDLEFDRASHVVENVGSDLESFDNNYEGIYEKYFAHEAKHSLKIGVPSGSHADGIPQQTLTVESELTQSVLGVAESSQQDSDSPITFVKNPTTPSADKMNDASVRVVDDCQPNTTEELTTVDEVAIEAGSEVGLEHNLSFVDTPDDGIDTPNDGIDVSLLDDTDDKDLEDDSAEDEDSMMFPTDSLSLEEQESIESDEDAAMESEEQSFGALETEEYEYFEYDNEYEEESENTEYEGGEEEVVEDTTEASAITPVKDEAMNLVYRFLAARRLDSWLMMAVLLVEWCKVYLSPFVDALQSLHVPESSTFPQLHDLRDHIVEHIRGGAQANDNMKAEGTSTIGRSSFFHLNSFSRVILRTHSF